VASVKDDAAAWARANVARADSAASRSLSDSLGQIRVGVAAAIAIGEIRVDVLADMRATALAAADPSLSATARQDLQNRFTQLRNAYNSELSYTAHDTSIELKNSGGSTWAPYSATLGNSDLTWTNATDGAASSQAFGSVMTVLSTDISSSAAAATTLANVQAVENQMLQRTAALARIDHLVDADQSRLRATSDRLSAISSSLTDADLGRASTARAQAEIRQQLALDTISRAISAYGNFAGGLLGNVQRTQRGVLA
jgi:flagellin